MFSSAENKMHSFNKREINQIENSYQIIILNNINIKKLITLMSVFTTLKN